MESKNCTSKDVYSEASKVSLQIFQQAIAILANWAAVSLSQFSRVPKDSQAILQAKHLAQGWQQNSHLDVLRALVDNIKLVHGTQRNNLWPMVAIANSSPSIPYLVSNPIDSEIRMKDLKEEIEIEINQLSAENWNNLSLLSLILEKYGSYLSFGDSDIPFFDQIRITAAIASSLIYKPDAENLCLVGADLSGIQSFIYTIASDGALKSLRARSFYLELVAEEVTLQLLECLQLPRTNVIYIGGGKSFILAPATEHTQKMVAELKATFNKWLRHEFQGKICLNLAAHDFPKSDVGTSAFADQWQCLNKLLSLQKSRKFDQQIGELLSPQAAHDPCRVCNRDDFKSDKLKPLGEDGSLACPSCHDMLTLGQRLYRVGAIVRDEQAQFSHPNLKKVSKKPIRFNFNDRPIYYHLFELPENDDDFERQHFSESSVNKNQGNQSTVYLVNNWTTKLYRQQYGFTNPTLLLLGSYGQSVDVEDGNVQYRSYMSAAQMCKASKGIERLGHLRMDVDRLGQIFSKKGIQDFTLPRLAGLSRQMSYFFKVYLNSLAENRRKNILEHQSNYQFKTLTLSDRPNLLFIYSGGDDLFVTGAWNELVEFAFDVYQSFRAYTGNHPDITLSGGISLSGPKYPLYQSAADSGDAEERAKGNGRDSLTLFDQVFKWEVWLGAEQKFVHDIRAIASETRSFIGGNPKLELFGILPFVTQLNTVLANIYPQSFVKNLLATAQLQEQFIKDARNTKPSDQTQKEHIKDIRYFLHLPRIAYTLARLPKNVQDAEGFDAIRMSLKSPYNAPYFRAIATWIDLLNRSSSSVSARNNPMNHGN